MEGHKELSKLRRSSGRIQVLLLRDGVLEPVPTLEVYSIDPRIETLAAYTEQSYRLRKSRIPNEKLSEWAVNELTGKLADSLASYMRLDIREDPVRECTVIQGTVRIVPPDFRY